MGNKDIVKDMNASGYHISVNNISANNNGSQNGTNIFGEKNNINLSN